VVWTRVESAVELAVIGGSVGGWYGAGIGPGAAGCAPGPTPSPVIAAPPERGTWAGNCIKLVTKEEDSRSKSCTSTK
jgi:hypothetical protein